MESKLIAGGEAVAKYIIDAYKMEHPIISVWLGTGLVNPDEYQSSVAETSIEYFRFLVKEQIYSLFFPNGIIFGNWNLVLLALKQETEDSTEPPEIIQGWILNVDFEKMSIDFEI